MNVRRLDAPVGPALTQAAADLVAAAAGTAEEWQLPDGTHALAEALTLDVAGRTVRVRGSDRCRLAFAAGGLTLRGEAVEVIELRVETAAGTRALHVEASRIALTDVDAAATSTAAVVAVDLESDGGTIDVQDLLIIRATGANTVGFRARGLNVRVVGAVVNRVQGTIATGVRVGAVGDADVVDVEVNEVRATAGDAIGALVAAGGRIDIARIRTLDLTGASIFGVAVLGFGAGATPVSVVDLDVGRLTATERATGIMVAAPRRLTVRGFSAMNLAGAAGAGAVIVGGVRGGPGRDPDIEVGFGRITRVVASGGDAAGVRVVGMPSARPLIVRDVAVFEIAGAPVPAGSVPPRDADGGPAWQSWAAGILADLADDAQPRTQPPAVLAAADVVGLAVTAMVDEIQPFLDEAAAGDVAVVDTSLRTISGSAIQIETGLRPAWLRRLEVSTALRAGFVQADRLIVANTTWDRAGSPLAIGPGEIRAYDSLFSRITSTNGPVALDPDADWIESHAVFADSAGERFEALGALPYITPGPPALPAPLLAGQLPPRQDVDLRLAGGSTLHRRAVPPPADDLALSDDVRLFVGAHAPDVPAVCDLYDPLRAPAGVVLTAAPPSPVVDYRARDAQSLMTLMLERAQRVMPPWTDRGPADFTTMMLETVAERLDHLAYQQERAVAEAFLDDARLRRSVEDHVRPLDYQVDPGLSATTMVRFQLDLSRIASVIASRRREIAATNDTRRAAFLSSTLAALRELAQDGALEIPAGTLAANLRDEDHVLIFATEEPLAYFPALEAVALVADVPAGATSAILTGALPELTVGRWLVLWRGPGRGGHVVRVTTVARGTDVVEVGWDPRRPLPWPLAATSDPDGERAAVVLGNVTPAHHGVPLSALPGDNGHADLARFQDLLTMTVTGGPGVELPLPFAPVSIHAPGYPLPGDERRRGRPAVRVLIENDEWTRVEDLCTADPGDEVFALRASADGRASLRFGDGTSGAALPGRGNRVRIELTVGAGQIGNVGEGIVGRLLYVPVDRTRGPMTGWLFREDMDVIRGLLTVDNPIPATGGRDPEPTARISYRAPLLAARPVSAVTPEDYERIVRALPDVAGAHARVVRGPVRPLMRVTVLLRDEDTLDRDERLRRWAAVRAALEGARLLGFDVEAVPPTWAPLDLDVVVDAHPHAEAGLVRDGVILAVAGNGGLLDPDASGLGGDVQLADLYRAVLSADGVAAARVRRFRRMLLHAPECLQAGVIAVRPEEVAIVRGPARPVADGLLTVTVCGGLT